jgi:hypothetical protein
LDIVLIPGFSSLKGEERLKLLIEEIKKEFPKAKVIVTNYLEKYGRLNILRAGRKSIIEYATICKGIIEKERTSGPLGIIGYSLGGLITRVLIETMGIHPEVAILVGTPNWGIKLSWWEKWILKMIKRPVIEEMKENSKFLQEINENYRKIKPRDLVFYYLIIGTIDKRVPMESADGRGIRRWGLFGRKFYIWANHSGLIPKQLTSERNAIEKIIEILKWEIQRGRIF